MRNHVRMGSTMVITMTSENSMFRTSFIFSWSINSIISRSLLFNLLLTIVWNMCSGDGSMLDVTVLQISLMTATGGGTGLEGLADVFDVMYMGLSPSRSSSRDATLDEWWYICEISRELGVYSRRWCHVFIMELELVCIDGEGFWISGVDLWYDGARWTCKVSTLILKSVQNSK